MFNKRDYLYEDLNKQLEDSRFFQYYEELIKINKITNLTRITDIDSVYYKHFYDSIVLIKYLNLKNMSLLDVGSGAGFPSLPLKIVENSLKVTIVDSLNKRIKFLDSLTQILNLKNIKLIHGRAEEMDLKNYFDIVTSRAVAKLNILIELTLPFVKVGGYFIAYKSINYQEELNEAINGINTLGGSIEKVIEYEISKEEKRVLIFIKKIKKTDYRYPRIFGKIKKSPL